MHAKAMKFGQDFAHRAPFDGERPGWQSHDARAARAQCKAPQPGQDHKYGTSDTQHSVIPVDLFFGRGPSIPQASANTGDGVFMSETVTQR